MIRALALLLLTAEPTQASPDAPAQPAAQPAPFGPAHPPPLASAPPPSAPTKRKTGRGLLIAGSVLTGVGALGRVGLEVFWTTTAGLKPGEPFGRWSLANIAFLTNWNSVMFFGPGLGLLTAGAHRRGRDDAARGRPLDLTRRHKLGVGLLSGGLGLFVLSRALLLPLSRACDTNACFYGAMESTFWVSAGATFVGATQLAYTRGARRGANISLVPSLGRGFAGLAAAGAF